MESLLHEVGVQKVDGILLDIGVSSLHLDEKDRGFSFKEENDAPLDMRMDQSEGITAAHVVNTYSERSLTDIFWRYGEERFAAKIAIEIVRTRKTTPILTTFQLASLIRGVRPSGKSAYLQTVDPATKVFQALRVYVNQELEEFANALRAAERLLSPSGRIVTICFQPSEDKIAKEFFQATCLPQKAQRARAMDYLGSEAAAIQPSFRFFAEQIYQATDEEVAQNPRARSAKLRCAERTRNPPIGYPIEATTCTIDWSKL